jgi:hypothetical protein
MWGRLSLAEAASGLTYILRLPGAQGSILLNEGLGVGSWEPGATPAPDA